MRAQGLTICMIFTEIKGRFHAFKRKILARPGICGGKDIQHKQKGKRRGMVSTNLLNEKEELQLWEIYTANEAKIRTMIQDKKYVEASFTYNEVFAEPVHAFFEKVFVNVEDMEIRNNRLLLLREINQLYSEKIADLSQIIMTEKD